MRLLQWRHLVLNRKQGFTLIELLIVIAIILILIAIALPNFLEAQIRARVVKAKGELRTLGQAMEAYYLDFKIYPAETEGDYRTRGRSESGHTWLTSPIAYITSVPEDPFAISESGATELRTYESGGPESGLTYPRCPSCLTTWAIYSSAPSGEFEPVIRSAHPHFLDDPNSNIVTYAPTNGTRSSGIIHIWGGDPFWIGVTMELANMSSYRANPAALDRGLLVDGVRYLHRLPPPLK